MMDTIKRRMLIIRHYFWVLRMLEVLRAKCHTLKKWDYLVAWFGHSKPMTLKDTAVTNIYCYTKFMPCLTERKRVRFSVT
jgi:hypothetical protein